MTSFPDSWSWGQNATGVNGTPQLALPATPGIAHVLTGIGLDVITNAAYVGGVWAVLLEVLISGQVSYMLGYAQITGASQQATASWDGVIAAPVGKAVTVTPNVGNHDANMTQLLRVTGRAV